MVTLYGSVSYVKNTYRGNTSYAGDYFIHQAHFIEKYKY